MRRWTALVLAACTWLGACAGPVEHVAKSPYHCDRNGTMEEREACS